jgi:hypothetical protein
MRQNTSEREREREENNPPLLKGSLLPPVAAYGMRGEKYGPPVFNGFRALLSHDNFHRTHCYL